GAGHGRRRRPFAGRHRGRETARQCRPRPHHPLLPRQATAARPLRPCPRCRRRAGGRASQYPAHKPWAGRPEQPAHAVPVETRAMSFSGTVKAAATTPALAELSRLAHIIWREHYPPIIGHEHVEYMLARGYTPAALAAEQAAGGHFLLARD